MPRSNFLEGDRRRELTTARHVLSHNANRDFIYHGGDNEGFHGAAVASADGRCGFVAMTNGENGTATLRNLLAAERLQQFLEGGR